MPYDATDRDDNQELKTCAVHGTAYASIAAAMWNNGIGVAGVSWNARIMLMRIATIDNCATPPQFQNWITSNAIIEDGLGTAVNRGAHVLSNSWGEGSTDTYMSLFGPNNPTTLMAENNAIEVGKNFDSRIIRTLNRGTYHVTLRHYSSSGQGAYTMIVQTE